MKRSQTSIIVTAAAVGFVGAVALHASGTKTPTGVGAIASTGGSNSTSSTTTPIQHTTNSSTPPAQTGSTVVVPTTTTPNGGVSTTVRSATGSMEQYGYGQLAVHVTVQAAKITGLEVVGLQTAESYSQQIANQVLPILKGEVLSAQSLQVNGISGATYTAEAYVYSIQSALNRLHLK